jgi:hypothetical protein
MRSRARKLSRSQMSDLQVGDSNTTIVTTHGVVTPLVAVPTSAAATTNSVAINISSSAASASPGQTLLTRQQVEQYFREWPSINKDLCTKVIVSLALQLDLISRQRVGDLYRLRTEDVTRTPQGGYRIKLPATISKAAKADNGALLLPPHTPHSSITHPSQWLATYMAVHDAAKSKPEYFLHQIRNGKLTQRIGVHSVTDVWAHIAQQLKLPQADQYRGVGDKHTVAADASPQPFTSPVLDTTVSMSLTTTTTVSAAIASAVTLAPHVTVVDGSHISDAELIDTEPPAKIAKHGE